MTVLEVGICTRLNVLDCSNNRLTALDISTCTGLTWLGCDDNLLTILDVGICTGLDVLNCSNNRLTTLDISACTGLTWLDCCHNKLNTLDLRNCPVLRSIANSKYYVSEDSSISSYGDGYVGIEGDGYYSYFLSFDSNVTVIFPTTEPAHILVIAVPKSKNISSVNVNTVWQINLNDSDGKSFRSSNKSVATVDKNGLITAKSAGKTRITFKVGKKKRTLILTVKDPSIPTSIKLNMSGIKEAKKGDTLTLVATMNEGAVSGIKWTTNKKRVATVKDGVVKFKNPGKVTITATTVRGKKKAEVKFKVTK